MSDLRDQIAEAIQDAGEYIPGSHGEDYINPDKAADAVLAVVEAHTRAAQAQALRDAADLLAATAPSAEECEAGPALLSYRNCTLMDAGVVRRLADELDPRPEEAEEDSHVLAVFDHKGQPVVWDHEAFPTWPGVPLFGSITEEGRQ